MYILSAPRLLSIEKLHNHGCNRINCNLSLVQEAAKRISEYKPPEEVINKLIYYEMDLLYILLLPYYVLWTLKPVPTWDGHING